MDQPVDRLRRICMSFPQAVEKESWGAPTFRVKTIFAMYSAPEGAGPEDRAAAWVKSDPVNQDLLIQTDAARFFKPPYVGPKGWIGVYLDDTTDWDQLADLLWDAWRRSVTKTLAAEHPNRPRSSG